MTEFDELINTWRKIKPWSGRVGGLIIGYLIAGSYGGVFGILIGNVIDRLILGWLFHPLWKPYRESSREIKKLIVECLFKLLGYIAKTNGQITELDITFARKLMTQMRLHGSKKKLAMHSFNQGKSANFDVHQTLNMINQGCQQKPILKKIFVNILAQSTRHKFLSVPVKSRLNLIYMRLGFRPLYPYTGSDETVTESGGAIDDYQILGIASSASNAEIKRMFRRRIKQIHPDKLIAQGASEAEIRLANEKTARLQSAYHRIKNSRGF